jgi:predicted TIM-barrel fold metal-dependent hydrolase
MPASALEIPKMLGIGDAKDRTAESEGREPPSGTIVVSADSHWLEGDIWIDRFPDHLKHRAPRVFERNGGYEMEIDGKCLNPPGTAEASCAFECVPGFGDVPTRLRDLDAEGVQQEILFPQKFFHLLMVDMQEEKPFVTRAYNQALADFCAHAPGRLHGVGILDWWTLDGVRDAIDEIKALGLKALMIPIAPRERPNGEPFTWYKERMDPFWDAVEESGLPLCYHIGEKPTTQAEFGSGASVLYQMGGMRNIWASLTFGGVFDRHPKLRVVFVEGQLHWVPGALQDADMLYESFPHHNNPRLKQLPSWYWHNHCYATFMVDPAGLSMVDRIGAERCLWSSDYPHNESTFGYTRSAVTAVFDATTEANARKIVGENAIALFGLPRP